MATRKFSELLDKMAPERRAQVQARVRQEVLQLNLKELRKLTSKTQAELAAALDTTQGQVSVVENRSDHLLSTVRRYVEALGGELDVVARFGDKTFRLKGI